MKALIKWLAVLFVAVSLISGSAFADKGNFSTAPKTKADGSKWRIGYYEGGPFVNYQLNFIATIKGLMKLGWIETTEIPPQKDKQTTELWNWLSTRAKSKYIEFVKDAHYSANWDRKGFREKIAAEIISRLNQKKDIDLIIAMGTWAGKDLANSSHKVPTMVMSVSDALASGIIKSVEDSGFDHVHARVDPLRYERQVQIFHDVIQFQKLGMAYENTVNGRSYAAIDKVEKIAKERGFEIVSCHTVLSSQETAEETVKKCFRELGDKKVDAIYATLQIGINKETLPELVKIANSYKIPTFSQRGSGEVKNGFLLSLSMAGFRYVGEFYAETMAKIFNGAKPRQLEQIFQDPPKIAINLKTAQIIGYDPPMEVLGLADETYQEIEIPE